MHTLRVLPELLNDFRPLPQFFESILARHELLLNRFRHHQSMDRLSQNKTCGFSLQQAITTAFEQLLALLGQAEKMVHEDIGVKENRFAVTKLVKRYIRDPCSRRYTVLSLREL